MTILPYIAGLSLAVVITAQTQPAGSPPGSGIGTLLCHYEPTTASWGQRRVPQDQVAGRLAQGDVLGACQSPTPEATGVPAKPVGNAGSAVQVVSTEVSNPTPSESPKNGLSVQTPIPTIAPTVEVEGVAATETPEDVEVVATESPTATPVPVVRVPKRPAALPNTGTADGDSSTPYLLLALGLLAVSVGGWLRRRQR